MTSGHLILRSGRLYLWPIIVANSTLMVVYDGGQAITGVLVGAGLCLLASFGFVLNDLVDRETDRVNEANRLENADRQTLVMASIVGGLCLFLGLGVLMAISARAAVAGVGVAAVLSAYSLFLRKVLLVSNLSAALVDSSPLWMPLVVVGAKADSFQAALIMAALIFFVGREILLDVKDLPGDLHGNRVTFATVFGRDIATFLATLLIGFGAVLFSLSALYLRTDHTFVKILVASAVLAWSLRMLGPAMRLSLVRDNYRPFVLRSRMILLVAPVILFMGWVLRT